MAGVSEALHMSNAVTAQLVRFVDRRAGEAGVARLLELAGETRPIFQLEDLTGWSSWDQGRALLEAAGEVLGGTHLLREVAHEWVRVDAPGEVVSLLQSLGSPAEILRCIAAIAAKFSTVVAMEPVEVGADFGVVRAEEVPGYPRYQALCDYTAGLLAICSMLFGLAPAQVEEESCQLRGDPHCVYRVRWSVTSATQESVAEFLRSELAVLATRFETFKSTASELVSGEDVETLLGKITHRAATAVRAPAYVLVVRADGADETRVHHFGVPADELPMIVDELLSEEPDDRGGSRLIAEVASGSRRYGRLAALFPDGARFLPEEKSLLSAYAELAAAALDSATALDTSRREAATARALLELAAALAVVTSPREMAERLVQSVPKIVSCDHGSVYLFDANQGVLRADALFGFSPEVTARLSQATITIEDVPGLARMLERPEPLFLQNAKAPYLRDLLQISGTCAAVVVPLLRHDRFYGVLTVGVTDQPERLRADPDLLDRLRGLADQAATALENAELVERIRYQALHDSLTGLPNRTLLEERARDILATAGRRGLGTSLLFVDLDRFKVVNDTLGHGTGDELIRRVACRLESCLRVSDTLARLGGDEFAVLIPDTDGPAHGAAVAQKLIDALATPFTVAGKELFVSCSIGIASSPEHGSDYDALLRHADAAMYEAKAQGRNTFEFGGGRTTAGKQDMLELESALHRAISNDELRVLYQPQIDLRTMEVVGAEALVRWQHPTLGLIGPVDFLPLAEESGLIVEIDRWVRDQAFREAAAWGRAGLRTPRMAVNLSTRELRNPYLALEIQQSLEHAGLAPEHAEIEITDRVTIPEEELISILRDLKALGVRIAVDDFGTGSSVLTRLNQFPIDTLKIDKSFIAETGGPDEDVPLLRALVTLAHNLGLDLVAEGVETPAQAGLLRGLGCHIAQGFFFSRPVPSQDLRELMHDRSGRLDAREAR